LHTKPQVLLIDADDTLWETESYFRRSLEVFLDLAEDRGHRRDHVLHLVRGIEVHRCSRFGYGSHNFARSLVDAIVELEGPPDPQLETELLALGDFIRDHPLEVFPKVPETLASLAARHRLLCVTKGDPGEQEAKIARSGLRHHFSAIEILLEKDRSQYEALAHRHRLALDTTWMVGNSPRSDINPARAAGLRTIFIPHRSIWELEEQTFDTPPDLELRRFRDLTAHF
jgi:putative hydrolase of the HAD superfamily